MNSKLYFKMVAVALMVSISNFSQAIDLTISPSLLNGKIARAFSYLLVDQNYSKTPEELWKEYQSVSDAQTAKIFAAASDRNVSLKTFMCTKNSKFNGVNEVQKFQNVDASNFGFDNINDKAQIAKINELQQNYTKLCSAEGNYSNLTDEMFNEQNFASAKVIAETITFTIYYPLL